MSRQEWRPMSATYTDDIKEIEFGAKGFRCGDKVYIEDIEIRSVTLEGVRISLSGLPKPLEKKWLALSEVLEFEND